MNSPIRKLTLALLCAGVAAGAALAGGPLFLTDDPTPRPFLWDTTRGTIPVWTDGGGAFTYDYDGVTPFLTIERANEITQFAFGQWSAVPTSTLRAEIAGTIASRTGIADVTGANATEFYGVENGYGIWVLYDTDGDILEDYFGVSRDSILGIAFPEWADANGTITEATVVLNGWNVHVNDTQGEMVAGVFTHEFGHALNLSHSQVNGPLATDSPSFSPNYPGVPGCGVEPVYNWNANPNLGTLADPYQVETMYPFIAHTQELGRAMSYVATSDDAAALSDLYPTPDYRAATGSISGTLYLKDGVTEFSGINVIARNVNDLTGDAVSAMTGSATQGQVGPDGRYTINNLTPGEEYVVYLERIYSGGYPTQPMQMVSEQEYWNGDESHLPSVDDPCAATPILAEAGVTKKANFFFNGYRDGIDFRPVGPFFLVDLAKGGKTALGQAGTTPFLWNTETGIRVIEGATVINGGLSRDGSKVALNADLDGDGMGSAAIWSTSGRTTPLGFLGDGQCGGGGTSGVNNSIAWAISDDGNVVSGLAYIDRDGNGNCQQQNQSPPEITGFVWTARRGMQEVDLTGYSRVPSFIRAHAMSGDGKVILGADGPGRALAWVDGKLVDLYTLVGGREVYASNFDGSRVAISTASDGVVLWDARIGTSEKAFRNIGGPQWCEDLDYVHFFLGNLCEQFDPQFVQDTFGPIPVLPTDMTDDGSVLVGRGGTFNTGFIGTIWTEQTGWTTWERFLREQAVPEASIVPFDNPLSITGDGSTVVGGLAGSTFSWRVDLNEVMVCENGVTTGTRFPAETLAKVEAGAALGRCEHLD